MADGSPYIKPAGILQIKQPQFPDWRFEWHPDKEKVYLVRLGRKPLIGEVIAEHVPTEGSAFGSVQTWLRGFEEGRTPNVVKSHLQG
jgi:hypothetical protein